MDLPPAHFLRFPSGLLNPVFLLPTMSSSPLLRSALHQSRRWLSATSALRAVTKFEMPAMSPTMTEGGIASWKKREGETFTAGDVLLEIETDKATIDVEAQDDGIVGKILMGRRTFPLERSSLFWQKRGDDISNLEIPKDEPTPSKSAPVPKQEQAPLAPSFSCPTISHSRPLFPSVSRLLQEYGVQDPEKIKGTGVRGMLTKGDVLAFLGKASSPTEAPKKAEAKVEKVRPGQLLYNSYSILLAPAIGRARNSPAHRPKYVSDGTQGARRNRSPDIGKL
ncbi:single hybrid motif-containing protein [Lactarius hatsudake]|nr:single hybrid motif-containing protein [Lactarius hatsudake]